MADTLSTTKGLPWALRPFPFNQNSAPHERPLSESFRDPNSMRRNDGTEPEAAANPEHSIRREGRKTSFGLLLRMASRTQKPEARHSSAVTCYTPSASAMSARERREKLTLLCVLPDPPRARGTACVYQALPSGLLAAGEAPSCRTSRCTQSENSRIIGSSDRGSE